MLRFVMHLVCIHGQQSYVLPTPALLCVYMSIRTNPGHAESLYIEMRDPRLSFSSRAAKTNKGSPTPLVREEAVITHHIIYGVHPCRGELSITVACIQYNRMDGLCE